MRFWTSLLSIAVLAGGASSAAVAADAAAGKAVSDAQCANCHEAADWQGEDVAELVKKMKEIEAGTVKHKTKLKLTDAQIANVAAYWSAGK